MPLASASRDERSLGDRRRMALRAALFACMCAGSFDCGGSGGGSGPTRDGSPEAFEAESIGMAQVDASRGEEGAASSSGGSGLDATLVESGSSAPAGDSGRSGETGTDPGDGASREGAGAGPRQPTGSGDGGGPGQCAGRAPLAAKWGLAWADEFDKDGAPDPSSWGFESGFVRNQELQWYQPNSATVAGGLLTIAAERAQVPNPGYVAGSTDWRKNRAVAQYTSASMTTAGKRSFQYGRFEICAQIDTRQGSWPAFWVLGVGRGWPSSGEVDIMEYYASGVRANVCIPSGGNCDWSGSVSQALASLGGPAWSAGFHLWAMEWTATDVDLYLDDKLVYDFKVARVTAGTNPYIGNAFYILVNLAIGANGGDPASTTFPMVYKVDYVRVFQ